MTLRFPTSSVVRARARAVDPAGSGRVSFPIRYGLLVHPRLGPVLVDTGYTGELASLPGLRADLYRRLLAPSLDASMDPEAVLARAGMVPTDVRHVILTHLHPDHACGLARFGHARVHATRQTVGTWAGRPRWSEGLHGLQRGLLPSLAGMDVSVVEDAPQTLLPWGSTGYDILGDGSAIAQPLPGHMAGHMGVYFAHRDRPVLYAVDVSWTKAGYRHDRMPPLPLRLTLHDPLAARASMGLVRSAEEWGAEVVLCHDPECLGADLS